MHYRIAISSGDYNGVGLEVILKTLKKRSPDNITPIILGSGEAVDFYRHLLSMEIDYHHAESESQIEDGKINVLESYGEEEPSIVPGKLSAQAGQCAMLAVKKGIDLCNSHKADALVTAPISKEAINRAGYHVPGHTEFLAEHTGTSDFMMMLVNGDLRVGLATIHIPVSGIPGALSQQSISRYIGIMHKSLNRDFNIRSPKIAVLGLNPHAGDGGVIGTEEIDIISPAIHDAQSRGMEISGPHPADGFFGNRKYKEYHGILAMYHDQGLIPFKTLSFGAGVNFTAGLPFVRTSPDHGTAFDIAGQNKANPSSFGQAFSLAIQLTENRKKEAIS
ncbi:MAG: 4-hydroxythreonine-4-phosphate dehydrogenase PdxA [Balneolaceae bacterium]|jgi:4-hydroxythreonine-4-phosphate dehydrogenase